MSPWWVKISQDFVNDLPKNRPFTRLEAAYSLAVDRFTGKPFCLRGYARLWQWSTGKVTRFIEETDVCTEPDSTSNSQQNSETVARQKRNSDETLKERENNNLSAATKQQRDRNETVTKRTNKEEEKNKEKTLSSSSLFDAWNEIVKGSQLPTARALSKAREKKCINRLDERPVEEWREIISKMTVTPFLCGQNDRGWKADFDWIIANDGNAIKVLEGKYSTAGSRRAGNDNRYGMFAGA